MEAKGQELIDILLTFLTAQMQKDKKKPKTFYEAVRQVAEEKNRISIPFCSRRLRTVKECFSFDGGAEQEESCNLCGRLIS